MDCTVLGLLRDWGGGLFLLALAGLITADAWDARRRQGGG